MTTAIRRSFILLYERKETHVFWDPHQFPIFTSKRHRFLKYLKSNGAIDVPHWIRNISRIQLCVESFEFFGQSIWEAVSPKVQIQMDKQKLLKRGILVSWKGNLWKGAERKSRKIHIDSESEWIEKIVIMISKIHNFWESEFQTKNNLDKNCMNSNFSTSVFKKTEFW